MVSAAYSTKQPEDLQHSVSPMELKRHEIGGGRDDQDAKIRMASG